MGARTTQDYFRFVNLLIKTLDTCGVRYAIGGSLASSVYSEIRYTYDIDLTIQMTADQIKLFIKIIQELGWYISPEGVAKAVSQGGDFQVIDGMLGVKADCYVTNPTITSRQQRTLARARIKTYNAQGHQAVFFSPEDVILYKLEWYMLGKSDKHLRDIGAIISVQGDNLDYGYIAQYVDEVNGRETWNQLLADYRQKNGG